MESALEVGEGDVGRVTAKPWRSTWRGLQIVAATGLLLVVGSLGAVWTVTHDVRPIGAIGGKIVSGDTVTVVGMVGRVISAPMGYTLYSLSDETASIYVISKLKPPTERAHLRVVAVVRAAPSLLGIVMLKPVLGELRRTPPFFPWLDKGRAAPTPVIGGER